MQPPQQNYDTLNLIDQNGRGEYEAAQQQGSAFIYQIKGRPAFAFGDIWLKTGQKVIGDPKALLWMDAALQVETGCVGGCCAAYCRQCSGESFCLNTYSATGDNQKVSLGFELPGDMMAFGVTGDNGWVFTFDAFIAGSSNLIISSRFSGCCACICADESMFLTTAKVSSGETGFVLAGGYGMIERHDIPEGQTMLVSKGLFFAGRQDATFEVGLIGQECGGLLNCICTDGGIVFRFRGPCFIFTQSKSPIQLLRDFGIPGGKQTQGTKAYSTFQKILCEVLEVGAAAGNSSS